jgi:integrase
MQLRLITAQRGGEVTSMTWAEIDFANRWWTIPAEKSKNGLSHRVWLSAPALQILRDLLRMRDESERLKASGFVFPNPRDGSQPMRELQKAIQRIRFSPLSFVIAGLVRGGRGAGM